MTVERSLQRIVETYGHLSPEIIVKEATPETHPLHSHFTWDEAQAAHERRLDQAAQLIRMVYIKRITDAGELRVRMFHCERDLGRATPGSYVHIDSIVQDPAARAHRLRTMKRDWQAFRRRYNDMMKWQAWEEAEAHLFQDDKAPAE